MIRRIASGPRKSAPWPKMEPETEKIVALLEAEVRLIELRAGPAATPPDAPKRRSRSPCGAAGLDASSAPSPAAAAALASRVRAARSGGLG